MSSNPVSRYMEEHDVGTVEMAEKLGVSKGYMSQIKLGQKPISPRIAIRLGELTGRPAHEFMHSGVAAV